MSTLGRYKKILLMLTIFTCIVLAASVSNSEARTITCQMRGSVAGPVRNGKQLIIFDAVFRNVSRVEYIARVNWVEVSVHGYFNGREETYTRKVNVDWDFSPILEPGRQKGLKIKFWRKVQPRRGSFPYDDVEVQIRNINFKRAS